VTSFDPQLPYQELPKLPPAADFNDVELWKKVVRASDALSKLNGQIVATIGNLNTSMLMISPLFAPEAVASSAVENIITTTDEVLRAGALPESEMTSAQKEGRRYQLALLVGYNLLQKQGYLNTNSVISIQEALIGQGSGIRTIVGTVQRDSKTGAISYTGTKLANPTTKEVYYTPPAGEGLIRGLLQNLEIFFNEPTGDLDPLIKMAILHYQFEALHPFYDGNGRTGRILMPLYLVLTGKLNNPILFLSRYILDHRVEYYEKLRAVTRRNEWLEWVYFILEGVEVQAGNTSAALLQVGRLQDEVKDRLAQLLPKLKTGELTEFIFTRPSFTRQQMAEVLDVHVNTARTYSELLASNGIVEARRYKKTWVYSNAAMIRLLSGS
jgi:cell filamentation protein, protein adenylyltransferase